MNTARNGLSATHHHPDQVQVTDLPLVNALRDQIRKLETAGRPDDTKVISTGCPGLNRLLPDRGLVTGTITEWLTPASGCGGELLSLLAASQACRDGGTLVVIDSQRSFYPVAAAAWGINLQNVIVLRDPNASSSASSSGSIGFDAASVQRSSVSHSMLWAIDQALRCPAVAAVWGRLNHINERWQRRFQLSAEQSGAMGLFIRPARIKGQPGWAEVQWEISNEGRGEREEEGKENTPHAAHHTPHALSSSFDRFIPVRLLRARGGHANPNQTITLQIDFTTGKVQTVTESHERKEEIRKPAKHTVHLAARLANPKTGGRRQRA